MVQKEEIYKKAPSDVFFVSYIYLYIYLLTRKVPVLQKKGNDAKIPEYPETPGMNKLIAYN